MNNSFIEWLEKQELGEESKGLFFEAVNCYKADAYRAAYMFTFLGFQSMVKQRVLLSPTPEGYTDGEWNQVRVELANDDENWENTVQGLIKNKKKSAFKLSEDMYEQYFYWKNRRNDCAHAKGNYISYPHVEAFWLFIKSNSSKFTVNGGKNSIIRELEDHFDIHKTPIGSDILPILVKVPFAVEKKDLSQVFEKMKEITLRENKHSIEDYKAIMWEKLFTYVDIQESLISFLVDEANIPFAKLIFAEKPNLVKYFKEKTDFIRRLWIKEFSSYLDYYIFIEMVRNSLIPENQLNEACIKMVNTIDSDVFGSNHWHVDKEISEIDHTILENIGFFKVFYENAFKDRNIVHNFNWGNRNNNLVCYYIKHFGLNEEMVSALNSSFTTTYNPRHLNSQVIEFYQEHKDLWKKHGEISEKISERLPKSIRFEETQTPQL